MKNILYATTNSFKLQLAQNVLQQFDIKLESLPIDTPEIFEIQSDSQQAVAIDKAKQYHELLKLPLLVMDSGLFIEALGGFPGVYTKYVLDTIGRRGLLQLTADLKNKHAYTERTIVFINGRTTSVFSGRCQGIILDAEAVSGGRDYESIFYVLAARKSMAEMTLAERAESTSAAWHEVADWLNTHYF